MFSLCSALLLLLQPQSPGESSLALSTDCTQILPSNASRTHGHLNSTHNMLPSVISTNTRQNLSNTSPPTRSKRSDYPPNPAGASPRTAGFRDGLFSISPAERWGFLVTTYNSAFQMNDFRLGIAIATPFVLLAYFCIPAYHDFIINQWSNPWILVFAPVGFAIGYLTD